MSYFLPFGFPRPEFTIETAPNVAHVARNVQKTFSESILIIVDETLKPGEWYIRGRLNKHLININGSWVEIPELPIAEALVAD